MSNISPNRLSIENPPPIFAENREEIIVEDMPASREETDIAFAWWVSWLWSGTDSAESLLVNSPEHLRWLCSQRKLSHQDIGIYKNLAKMLLLYNKKYFTNKDKSFNPLTVSFSDNPQSNFKNLLISANSAQNIDQLVQDLFLYITRDLGLVQNGREISYLDKNIRAWGLHQLYLLNSVAVRALFFEHGIHFCRPWQLVQTPPLQSLFWNQLTDVQPMHTKNIEACCKDKSGTLLKTNAQFITRLITSAKNNMLFIHNSVFSEEVNDKFQNNNVDSQSLVEDLLNAPLLEFINDDLLNNDINECVIKESREIAKSTVTDWKRCSNVAFAWWYSWIWTGSDRWQGTHPFQTVDLQLKNFQEIRRFLTSNVEKYFLNRPRWSNLLNISCTPSPLVELQDILQLMRNSLQKKMPSLIEGVCIYIMMKAINVRIPRGVCAWGLHQVYLLYSQEVKDLFSSRGIEVPQSWDIHLIPQPLPPFFLQQLSFFSNETSSSIGQQPLLYPIQVALIRPENATKKRSLADMEVNTEISIVNDGDSIAVTQPISLTTQLQELACLSKEKEETSMQNLNLKLAQLVPGNITESKVAFAWWYSWIWTPLDKGRRIHPFQTVNLKLENFQEIRRFLARNAEKFFSNEPRWSNLLNVSCTPSPLAELQGILQSKISLQQTLQSLIGDVCVYIMVKATNVGLSRAVCAWGLHQVYLLYSQEVKYLFNSNGIEFLQSWNIHLIAQQLQSLNLPPFYLKQLNLLSMEVSSSIEPLEIDEPRELSRGPNSQFLTAPSIPPLYPIQEDLPRLGNATKNRSFVNMEVSTEINLIEDGDSIASINPSQKLACQPQEKEEIRIQNFDLELEQLVSSSVIESDLKSPVGEGFKEWQDVDPDYKELDFEDILNVFN